MNNHRPKVGDTLSLTIDSLAYGGKGVAKVEDFVIFVRGGLPQEKIMARIVKSRKSFAEAVLVEVLESSSSVVPAKCDHFPTCGGCTFQNLDYETQVEQKQQQVVDIYERIGGLPNVKLDRVVHAEDLFHYRNKMEFSFSNRRWILPEEDKGVDDSFALGLHASGRYDKILDIDTCWIQKPIGNEILRTVKRITREKGLEPYDVLKHQGFLRNLVIRIGERTGEVMVNLVTSEEDPNLLQPIVDRLVKEFPSITSIVNNVTRRKAAVSYGEWELTLHGSPYIHDEVGGYTFEISANSFFQTNTIQAEKLYGLALEYSDLSGQEIVYDLFCGTGSISIFMASHAKQILGFELIHYAVEDAVRNAVSNGVFNCRFFEANLDKYFRVSPILKKIEKPHVVVLDPPRAGMHRKLAKDVVQMMPGKIVYVSCNPSTQARDVALLQEGGYQLEKLAMVDMFPHTPHIETVAMLRKAGGNR